MVMVRQACEADFSSWDDYVRSNPEGTFCHLAGWKKVIERGAGQECPYLIAECENTIVGVLPLSFRKSMLFGNALISSMFAVYGGVVASTAEASEALEVYAWEMAQSWRLNTVSYKSTNAQHKEQEGWAVELDSAATFRKPLQLDEESILLDIPRKQRAVVRKSLNNGLSCTWEKDLDTFYQLYAVSVRNLGTPVFPKKLFASFLQEFGNDVEVQIIYSPEGKPLASLMSFYFKDQVLPYYAGGTVDARIYGAHDYMYYQLMVRAARKGKKVFDFGRSKVGTGPYKFKKNWGFEPLPLEYQHQLAAGMEAPNLSPSNRKFELMVKVWKKLPLGIANVIGPPIARHLG